MLHLFDTLSRGIVELRPRRPGEVSLYVCGPTVYDVPHLGHARTAVTYDVLYRYLMWSRHGRHDGQQHHRRRRQDHRASRGGGTYGAAGGGPIHRRLRRRDGCPRRGRTRRETAGDRLHRRDDRVRGRSAARRRRLCHRRGRGVLRRRPLPRLRPPPQPPTRRTARQCRRSRGDRRAQARPVGLRPLEGCEARRTRLGRPLDARAAGLAHRVRGHVAGGYSATASTSTAADRT